MIGSKISAPISEIAAVEENADEADDLFLRDPGMNSRRAFLKELRKVVEGADVILHVLDARDPIGTKSNAIEEMVTSNNRKKLVFILNKADLVPRDVLTGWLTYLRGFHPTVPFKCNTQNQKGNLGRVAGRMSKQNEGALSTTSHAVGAEELLGLLKNYCRSGDSKTSIAVGCVGFPNVGKSSLINSLLRVRSVGVSAVPGFTKVMQEVVLDKNIRLLDCPGVVFADGDSTATTLRNCVNVEEVEDVYAPVQAILERCPQQYLMQLYSIPKFKALDCMGFLALVAKVTGKLKKGGIPNVDQAGRSILHDWNGGKIKYYCKPPETAANTSAKSNQSLKLESKIVSSFSDEMDISDLQQESDDRMLEALDVNELADYVSMDNVACDVDMVVGEDSCTAAIKKSVKSRELEQEGDKGMMMYNNYYCHVLAMRFVICYRTRCKAG